MGSIILRPIQCAPVHIHIPCAIIVTHIHSFLQIFPSNPPIHEIFFLPLPFPSTVYKNAQSRISIPGEKKNEIFFFFFLEKRSFIAYYTFIPTLPNPPNPLSHPSRSLNPLISSPPKRSEIWESGGEVATSLHMVDKRKGGKRKGGNAKAGKKNHIYRLGVADLPRVRGVLGAWGLLIPMLVLSWMMNDE